MKKTLIVEDMSCNHCVKAIEDAINKLNNKIEINIDLERKTVEVEFDENDITLEQIINQIEEQGYTVK